VILYFELSCRLIRFKQLKYYEVYLRDLVSSQEAAESLATYCDWAASTRFQNCRAGFFHSSVAAKNPSLHEALCPGRLQSPKPGSLTQRRKDSRGSRKLQKKRVAVFATEKQACAL